jgi:hypothetical protein
MFRRASVTALTVVASLLAAAPAMAAGNFYIVYATADGAGAACAPYPNFPGGFTCDSLRAAVTAANADAGADNSADYIFLPTAGTYTLTQPTQLELSDSVLIEGQNARATTIQGNGSTRVFSVDPTALAIMNGLTISGGTTTGMGGNIANSGELSLTDVRITGGTANGGGGGLANIGPGSAVIDSSLIDDNSATTTGAVGGGILNQGQASQPASLEVTNSTIALNHAQSSGSGITTRGNAGNDTSLFQVTLARNTSSNGANPGGLSSASSGGSVTVGGSLFGQNFGDVVSNCDVAPTNDGGNVEDASGGGFTSCGFGTSVTTGIGSTLSSAFGGQTDVLAIPHTSPAKGLASPCFAGTDQRDAPRPTTGTCDPGAYEEGATAPPIPTLDLPQPPPPTPTPVPTPVPTVTPAPTPTPTPAAGKTVVVKRVTGKVLVKRPGGKDFVELDATLGIPVGSTVDTKDGTVQLTSQPKAGAKPQSADFFDGIFKITQSQGITDLALSESLAPCKAGKSSAAAAAKKPKTRKLWGNGSGSFRTRGQYSAATVRGTKWLVQDSCAGTLTKVTRGVVSVRDNVRHKTITLKAGKSYLARPRR